MDDSSTSFSGRVRRQASKGVSDVVAALINNNKRRSAPSHDAPPAKRKSTNVTSVAVAPPAATTAAPLVAKPPRFTIASFGRKCLQMGAAAQQGPPPPSTPTSTATASEPYDSPLASLAASIKEEEELSSPPIKAEVASQPSDLSQGSAAAAATPSSALTTPLNDTLSPLPTTPNTTSTQSPAASLTGPHSLEEALRAQQREYATVEATNRAHRTSTSGGLAGSGGAYGFASLTSSRPQRNKARPLAEFAPELVRSRPTQEERERQQREKDFRRQEAQLRRVEAEQLRQEKRALKLAQRGQAEHEKLIRQQSAQLALSQNSSEVSDDEYDGYQDDCITTSMTSRNSSRRASRVPSLSVAVTEEEWGGGGEATPRMRVAPRSVVSPAVAAAPCYAAYGTRESAPSAAAAPLSAAANSTRPFYDRMQRRARQNALACGLQSPHFDALSSRKSQNDAYFYREFLVRRTKDQQAKSAPHANESSDEELDVLHEEVSDRTVAWPFIPQSTLAEEDEILVRNVADDCVADIRGVLPREELNREAPAAATAESSADAEDDESATTSATLMDALHARVTSLKAAGSHQAAHLDTLLAAIVSQRYTDLQTQHIIGGCSMFYTRALKNAATLRQRLVLYSLERLNAAVDAHEWLVCKLPDEFLASYLNLLRFLKISNSSLPQHLVENPSDPADAQIRKANEFIREFVCTKVADPNLRYGKACQDIVRLSNISLVLVYPQVTMPGQSVVKHAHENMFRNLLPAAVTCVEKVDLQFDHIVETRMLAHMCLARIRERVQELVKRRPDDHVFLAGWGVSALLCMQAIQKVGGVSGVLNFAFPLRSRLGFRGTVDDSLCVTYCPTLFVVGDAANNVNIDEMQATRANMIGDTGLIVVGGADDNLYVTPSYLSVERVSQHCVDRLLLDHVTDFMRQVIDEGGMSAREKREFLVPVKTPNPFDVDLNTLKGRASGFVPKLRQTRDRNDGDVKRGPGRKPKAQDSQAMSAATTSANIPAAMDGMDSVAAAATAPNAFHRMPPPLSTAAGSAPGVGGASQFKASRGFMLPPRPSASGGGAYKQRDELSDARQTFNSALNRRRTTAVICMAGPKNPMDMHSSTPLTTQAGAYIKREYPAAGDMQTPTTHGPPPPQSHFYQTPPLASTSATQAFSRPVPSLGATPTSHFSAAATTAADVATPAAASIANTTAPAALYQPMPPVNAEQQMRAEAESAAASLGNLFNQSDNADDDEAAF